MTEKDNTKLKSFCYSSTGELPVTCLNNSSCSLRVKKTNEKFYLVICWITALFIQVKILTYHCFRYHYEKRSKITDLIALESWVCVPCHKWDHRNTRPTFQRILIGGSTENQEMDQIHMTFGASGRSGLREFPLLFIGHVHEGLNFLPAPNRSSFNCS